MSYSELPQVIAKISDWLEIDYLLGRVYYLEVNVTAGCSIPPNVIFNGLGTLAFFHGETKDDGGRVYKNSRNSKLMTRDLSFYNKYQKILAEGQEALSMAGEDLSYFMGLIPARVEYTLQGKALHKPNALYVRDLANREHWNVLLTVFAQQLEAIRVEQGSQRATDDFHPCTPLVLQRILASCGLRQYGRVQLERMFDQWQANGDITVHQKKALKESVEMLDLLGFGAPTEGWESTDFIRRCVEHLMAPVPKSENGTCGSLWIGHGSCIVNLQPLQNGSLKRKPRKDCIQMLD
ncbi:MAG: hypothetical protein J0I17_05200 ['Candidatus Kapabacteria' thiocyanatum]|uniref:Uncharacterized protein n=1 Tax=Candidatus Kapaibacterium thiocyanatum TaxID=1895771 RepID=A0A1M3L5D1_9BACT|nr:hypothetical protein ['Candidatus Kapabacteria' thiocyanatum]OJX60755.1 MAG: hypothetical protein BGO89_04075 ['Candidatus Kapabacteria' thiocyanatum]